MFDKWADVWNVIQPSISQPNKSMLITASICYLVMIWRWKTIFFIFMTCRRKAKFSHHYGSSLLYQGKFLLLMTENHRPSRLQWMRKISWFEKRHYNSVHFYSLSTSIKITDNKYGGLVESERVRLQLTWNSEKMISKPGRHLFQRKSPTFDKKALGQ